MLQIVVATVHVVLACAQTSPISFPFGCGYTCVYLFVRVKDELATVAQEMFHLSFLPKAMLLFKSQVSHRKKKKSTKRCIYEIYCGWAGACPVKAQLT